MKNSRSIFYLILIIVTLIDILLLFYALLFPVSASFRNGIFAFDLILCVVLWIEFIYGWRKSDRKQYLKNNSLSVFGMLPFDFVFLRALRLIKLFQLIRLFVFETFDKNKFSKFLRDTLLDKIIPISIIVFFILAVLIRIFDSNINDVQTAVWYIIVSMTSTGYGDVVPATISGRIIGMAAMISGIVIFAIITAVVSSQYVSRVHKGHNDEMELRIEKLTAEVEKLNEKIDELRKE